MKRSLIKLRNNNIFVREIAILLFITSIALLLHILNLFLSPGIDKSISLIKIVTSDQFILFFVFLYTCYLFFGFLNSKFMSKRKKLIISGLIGFIGGIICFLLAGLMYIVGNMSFWNSGHFLVMYLSPLLVVVSLILIINGTIKAIRG